MAFYDDLFRSGWEVEMDTLIVSIAEGKRDFTKIIRASEVDKQRIIVSRRGTPVAMIIPYEEYEAIRKAGALATIKETRAVYGRSNVKADEIHEISRKELESRK
jgi:prevent-host-death family protein